MGCGCRKRTPSDARVVGATAGARLTYEVWANDAYTGRSFTSLISAQRYALKVNGEVRAS